MYKKFDYTVNHPRSKNGVPVFIDEEGNHMLPKSAIKRIGQLTGCDTARKIGKLLHVSQRTVAGWMIGKSMSARSIAKLVRVQNRILESVEK